MAAKLPPCRSVGVSTPCTEFQPRATTRRGSHIASGDENQWGLNLPGRPRCSLPRDKPPPLLLHHQPWGCTALSPTTGKAILFPLVLRCGQLAAPDSDIWDPLFWVRPLVESQTVTELCGFGTRAGLPLLMCTAGASHPIIPSVLNHSHLCPAEFSYAKEP